jgi:diguanylate cyclase (GGDEF)-like protein
MDDDDFDLDELINSHSTKGGGSGKDLSDFEDELKNVNEQKSSKDSDIVDYNISDELDFDKDISFDDIDDEVVISTEKRKPSSSLTIEDFTRTVVAEIEERGLPATPENYKIYFMEFLLKESDEFQDKVYEILDREKVGKEEDKKREIEETLQKSLKLTQQLLSITSKVHGNISIMKNIAHKREEELESRNSKDIVKLLRFDLSKLETILQRQGESMKGVYGRTVETVNSLYEKTIFDKEFGVYNRRFFLESIEAEIQKMNYFRHSSSVALLIPHKKLTSQNLTPKVALVIAKTIAKILLEQFKRSDVVSYYGNNIFAILITHSNIRESEEKIERLSKALRKSSLFISGKEIELKVKVGLSELLPHRKIDTSLLKALDALKIANRSEEKLYEVVR